MTEDRLTPEKIVNLEVEKLHGLYVARRGRDHEMREDEVQAVADELLAEFQTLPLEAGAEEIVYKFGNGRVGRRSSTDLTAPDGFLWVASSVGNLGEGNRFTEGFEHGFVYKQSPLSARVNRQAPNTFRLAQVTKIGSPTGDPVRDVEHSFFAWQAGKLAFEHSATNNRQGVLDAKALIAEFRAVPKG